MDGQRAFFCITIMLAHWDLAFPIAPIGWECLQTFFVLSGFLITRILLVERERIPRFGKFMKVFVAKRSFRIFPLYFAYLGFWTLARWLMEDSTFIQNQTRELEHSGIWMWTYLYNFKSWFNFHAGVPFEDTRFFAHLWSLSVEEQFYLFFPFVVFFLRGKWLKGAIILLLILPQFTRIFGYPWLLSHNDDPTWAVLLIYRNIVFQYDALAMGAALAIFNFAWIKRPKLWFWITIGVILVIDVINFPYVRDYITDVSVIPFQIFITDGQMNWLGYIHALGHPELLQVNHAYAYMIPLVNIACFLMVLASIRGDSLMKWLFEHRFMIYLGKISYGMYVYHFATMVFFMKVLRATLPDTFIHGHYWLHIPFFCLYVASVILVSHLSFKYFESFFLRIKNRIRG